MGDAKRRKQLGLMPVAEERTVTLHRDGRTEGDRVPDAVLTRLRDWAQTGERWDARFRTTFIGCGLPRELLRTEDDLRNIRAPQQVRLRLSLLHGPPAWLAKAQAEHPESFFEEDGERRRQLSVRATEYDVGGEWAQMPDLDRREAVGYLTQHPAVMAEPAGETYTATVWHGGERDGRVDYEPEPPAEHRAALDRAAHEVTGDTDEAWLGDHRAALDVAQDDEPEADDPDPADPAQAAPLARRVTLKLSPVPLVLSPAVERLEQSGDMDVLFDGPAESYTLDGHTWTPYPEPLDREDQLRAMLAQLGLDDVPDLAALLGQAGVKDVQDDKVIDVEALERPALSSPAQATADRQGEDH